MIVYVQRNLKHHIGLVNDGTR